MAAVAGEAALRARHGPPPPPHRPPARARRRLSARASAQAEAWRPKQAAAPRRPRAASAQNAVAPLEVAKPALDESAAETPGPEDGEGVPGAAWTLAVLSLCYLHNSLATFVLPAILPQVSMDLHLSDAQAGALTSAQALFYALALVPCGTLADAADRRVLLALAVGAWSLTTAASGNPVAVSGFATLLVSRALLGVAQGPQNPVSFSLLPELFPRRRAFAIAVYNCSVYLGRGLSVLVAAAMASASAAGLDGSNNGVAGTTSSEAFWVPLDSLDPSSMSLLYIVGDQAAVTPVWQYGTYGALTDLAVLAGWRHTLEIVGAPGLALAALLFLTVRDPKAGEGGRAKEGLGLNALRERALACARVPKFRKLTAAAALNDVGFWALVAWQASFYARAYSDSDINVAPWLVAAIVIGGIAGGLGGGVLGDTLSRRGGPGAVRPLLAGCCALSAPLLAASLLAPSATESLALLVPSLALGEAYRAPCAVRVREVSPAGLASTAAALHLAVRNLAGAAGPLLVGALEDKCGLDLQVALLALVPPLYLLSGAAFWVAELD